MIAYFMQSAGIASAEHPLLVLWRKPKILGVSSAAACGGLLFGYDLGVTGGVTTLQHWDDKFFPGLGQHEGTSAYCSYNNDLANLWTSSMFLAGAGASIAVLAITNRKMMPYGGLGRRGVMVSGGAAFLIGALLQATAQNWEMLIIGRILLGVGIGFANEAVPPYISEMAPPKLRGGLNMLFQLMTTIGIFVASMVNLGVGGQEWGWRLSLGLACVPAVVFMAGTGFCPDTPNSILEHNPENLEKARETLRMLRPADHDIDAELVEIQNNARETREESFWGSVKMLYSKRHCKQAVATLLIPWFQQFSGINSIMFYAPQLFKVMGNSGNMALVNTCVTTGVNVVATIIGIVFVDKFGRKPLFYVAGVLMFAMQIATGSLAATYIHPWTQFTTGAAGVDPVAARAMVATICLFVTGFAFSWGPLGWLVPSEIHTNQTRTAGMCGTVFSNFIASFIIGQCFNRMLCSMEYGVFFFFAFWMVVMTLYVAFFLPETKDLGVENVMLAWDTVPNLPWRQKRADASLPVNAATDAADPKTDY
ncbi:Sugar transport protein 9 [Coccomyxa sp. Obi]|nr:Sugar transport protein 9 [Coccomyxa sp. Obi]